MLMAIVTDINGQQLPIQIESELDVLVGEKTVEIRNVGGSKATFVLENVLNWTVSHVDPAQIEKIAEMVRRKQSDGN